MQTPDQKQEESSGWNRLKQVIDWSGMSANRFAGTIGLKRSESLYQIKRGKNGISRRLACRIRECYPQIDFTWLMTGEGRMLADEKAEVHKVPVTLRLTTDEARALFFALEELLEKPARDESLPDKAAR